MNRVCSNDYKFEVKLTLKTYVPRVPNNHYTYKQNPMTNRLRHPSTINLMITRTGVCLYRYPHTIPDKCRPIEDHVRSAKTNIFQNAVRVAVSQLIWP